MAAPLDRDAITQAGLDVLAEHGLDGLTVRRVADRLGVQAPALYWHVKNKKELIDEMSTELWRRVIALTPSAGPSWEDTLRGFAAAMRSTLLGVRDGSRIFGGARSSDRSVYGSLGGRLASMADDGFSPADVRLAWIAVYLLVLGFCIEEQEVRSNPDLYDDTFPPDTRAADFEATFAGLLDTAIAGIRTRSG